MNKYTIHCTQKQTRKAYELGAPIKFDMEVAYDYNTLEPKGYEDIKMDENGEPILIPPTTDQMIGWLEEHGILVLIEPSQNKFYGAYSLKREDGCWLNRIFLDGLYTSRREAVLATIDTTLDYLINKNK